MERVASEGFGFPEGEPLAGQVGAFQPAFEEPKQVSENRKPNSRIVVFLLHGVVEAVTCTGDTEIVVIDGDTIDPDTGAACASYPFSISEECLCEEHPCVQIALEEIDSDEAMLEAEN